MNQKNVLSAVLGLAIGTMFAPGAEAAICLKKSTSGACLMWSGSVTCTDINANGLGNVTGDNPKYFSCAVTAPNTEAYTNGLVYCGNNGGNIGVGAQAYIPDGFSGLSTITPDQVDHNGYASGGEAHAEFSALSQADYDILLDACHQQNKNWFPIDFVPTAMTVTISVLESDLSLSYLGGTPQQAIFDCYLPNPETMTWDKKAGAPERRQYECTEIAQ